MRKLWYLFWGCLLTSNVLAQTSNIIQFELKDKWTFKKAGTNEWLKAAVPGTVHTDLLANERIQDPFYRTNEKDLQWIDKSDWIYQTTFDLPAAIASKEHIELDFKGLDTYADVYLNDKLLFKADNFFIKWVKDIKELLREKGNHLKIYFHSPTKIGLAALKKQGFPLPSPNDQSEIGAMGEDKVGIFMRKPGYHFGWDWGPRLVTSGIWQPVILKAWNTARVIDVFYEQQKVNAAKAEILTHVQIQAAVAGEMEISVETAGRQVVKKVVEVKVGDNNFILPFSLTKPELWWPHNLGNPSLYNFELILAKGDLVLDSSLQKIGLRDVQIIRKPDSAGSSFYVQINGVPVFCKGANYIPQDVFIPRVNGEKYESLLKSALAANMNMLRVWGGGFYEKDIFYNLCDEYGIMVWQDFMFACSMFPADASFTENVKKEAIYNVKRLRNHASIMLWCGNNEIDQAWGNYQEKAGWGWKQRYTEVQQAELWTTYQKIFNDILPNAVKSENPKAFYWTSSPYNKKYIHASDTTKNGDMHYWGVWHGEHDFEAFNDHVGRFMSEYGFQSFPEFGTVKKFTKPEDWKIESEVMMAHQRAPIGNMRIKSYLEKYYHFPSSFKHQLYLGQVLQAEGMKVGVEAHRRAMPFNMGSLYWQINDCWPVASWSGMDYEQNWKGLHYFVKKAFENVLISPFLKDDKLFIQVVSDSLSAIKATTKLAVKDFKGKVIWQTEVPFEVKANSSKLVYQIPVANILKTTSKATVLLTASLMIGTKELTTNVLYFDRVKNINLPFSKISFKEKHVAGGIEVSLSSATLAKNVYLDYDNLKGRFSDNYFDLLPGETKTVFFRTELSRNGKLQILTVKDTYSN
jgi:beta-mannosidase